MLNKADISAVVGMPEFKSTILVKRCPFSTTQGFFLAAETDVSISLVSTRRAKRKVLEDPSLLCRDPY